MYQHLDINGDVIGIPIGKVVCVGRNYVDHIKELNNAVPDQPLLFIKPATSLCDMAEPLNIPTDQGECHNELELAVLIGAPLKCADRQEVKQAIWGVGLGLDLTLRDVQSALKEKGLPWERAKSFDGACPLSGFVQARNLVSLDNLSFSLSINNQVRQQGNSDLMMLDMISLIVEMSHTFTLQAGDVIMTGTPKGVGPLMVGDKLDVELRDYFQLSTQVL